MQLLVLILSLATLWAAPLWAATEDVRPSANAAAGTGSVQQQLKDAVTEAQKSLGALEPWQVAVFQEEVIPQAQRFIKDYRQSDKGVTAVIDNDSLRRYLLFSAPKTLQVKDPKVMVFVRAEASCAKCTASAPEIQKLVKARVERRGWIPVWLTPEEVGDPKMSTKLLEDRVLHMAKQKGIPSVLMVTWQKAPVDDFDTAHADENRYQISTYLATAGIVEKNSPLELLENDPFEPAAHRLLTDAFTDLGMKLEAAQAAAGEAGKDEMLLEVTGIRDYAHFTRVRGQLVAKLKDVSLFEDRRFARGRVVFGLMSGKPVEELRKQLATLPQDPTWDPTLKWELK